MYNVSYILYVIIYIYTLYIYPYIDITYNFYNWLYPLAWSGCQRYACEALNWQFQSYGVDSNFLDLHSEWVNMTTKTYQDSSGIFLRCELLGHWRPKTFWCEGIRKMVNIWLLDQENESQNSRLSRPFLTQRTQRYKIMRVGSFWDPVWPSTIGLETRDLWRCLATWHCAQGHDTVPVWTWGFNPSTDRDFGW